MRLFTGQRLAIIASVIWVAVGPTYIHLNQEDHAKRVARDRYELCIKQAWAAKGGVERCNKELREALVIAQWSSWAVLAFVPLILAWLIGWGLLFVARSARSKTLPIAENIPSTANIENHHRAENRFPPPWTVEMVTEGFKVKDANGQSLAYVFSREPPNDAQFGKVLTLDEARRIASNIAKLPKLLDKS
jgi:hypothetical protein